MADKPHVLLISTDHWPNSLLGVSGHPAIQTPTLDSLACAGTRYTRGYSECPVCVPARKTLMTGATTRTHKDRVFNDRMGDKRTSDNRTDVSQCGVSGLRRRKNCTSIRKRDRIGF